MSGTIKALAPLLLCLVAGSSAQGPATNTADPLERGFQTPPDSAKPRVWWHWMNGNITKPGIQADLEWMKRIGIGGFQNFDAALATPQIVDKRLVYMTPEWKDAFRFTVTQADRLGLEMAIAGSPGWSESGGPWVPPAQAMKKFVWSETILEGGRPFVGKLPAPPSVSGPYQNIPRATGGGMMGSAAPQRPPDFYADSSVVAYRLATSDVSLAELQPAVTSSGGDFTLLGLTDGDLAKGTELPMAPVGEQAWIQFEFAQPQTVRALTLVLLSAARNPFGEMASDTGLNLESSNDGKQFTRAASIPVSRSVANTISFAPVTAKYFRVTFRTPQPSSRGSASMNFGGGRPPAAPTAHRIAELVLHPGARVNRFQEKAAFSTVPTLYQFATPAVAPADAVAKANVVDLTSKMRPDGTLEWTPPAGRWTILRIGYSLLGITNHPASPEATGLEVDKLNRSFVKAYADNYLDQYKDAAGGLMGKRGLQYVVIDSYEAGAQNWTGEILSEFAKRRGYDPHPWLPVLTGRVVESAEASDSFLWDFRKTIGDLMAEYHYDQFGASLKARGMGRYTEAHESGRAFIGDGMDMKRHADVPMSAMWTPRPGQTGESFGYNADIRESASVAHIYGQNIAAAESLTAIGSAWAWSPEKLKPTADKELANGLNRFVIHTSVHQPVDDKIPGLGLGPFGQWFTRHETWAEMAKPWTTYLARSSYMLQQGKFAADVAYFYGEDSNITALFSNKAPDIPAGYNFDYFSVDALLTQLHCTAGHLTTPSGMNYRVLALDPNSTHMSLPVLRKIRDLVHAGASVVGPKPVSTPSLSGNAAEFQNIVDQLWGSGTGERAAGKGKVYAGQSVAAALEALKVTPDFESAKPQSDTNLLFVHRKLADGEVYWVNNRNNRVETLDATFRVEGKAAEIWHPVTGAITPASYSIAAGHTTVPLRLEPNDAVFVVFRKAASTPARTIPKLVETNLTAIDGPWSIAFQPGRGAPEKATLDRLASWTENSDPGVKYFSGTGTYTQSIQAQAAWFQKGARLWLDLGNVQNLAEVLVNGKSLGIVWKTPFRVDVTTALKPGANTLEVRVANLWVNRLIGDQQAGAKKITYTTQVFYPADSPLLPSGLLGPVTIVRQSPE
ncbi:glycosyl hydrolase [Paludibaculum fermentans]|uniref:Glycoside hydrolase n=1 Tax=Paludibaculum fermentans TaxID=1473598 RepID=A0A7S7NJV9_PALFE|nr:glycosyl hydrolase [Paludibaculum fermentans]QOY84991.1 glycoside hydrolase [Paludibaculum fermentans]